MLEAAGTLRGLIIEQLIRAGYGGNAPILCYINLDLIVGATLAATRFHVIDACTSYNLLLGRP